MKQKYSLLFDYVITETCEALQISGIRW